MSVTYILHKCDPEQGIGNQVWQNLLGSVPTSESMVTSLEVRFRGARHIYNM